MSNIPQIEPNKCSVAISNLQDQFSELKKYIEMIKSANKELKDHIEKLNSKHSQHMITVQKFRKRAIWLSEQNDHIEIKRKQKQAINSSPSIVTKREMHNNKRDNQTKTLVDTLHIWKIIPCSFLLNMAWLTMRYWCFYYQQY